MSRVVTPLPEMRAAAPELIGALEPVYIAETEAEREAVFSFRYSVYGAELGRKLGHADHVGELVADAGFINCAAGLVGHYRLLGFRTYAGNLVPTADGIEVPLVRIPSDRAYLEQVGSFVAPFADLFYGPGRRAPVDVGRWARLLDADSAPVRFDAAAVWERVSRLRQSAGDRPSMLETPSEDTVRKLSAKGFLMNITAGQLPTEKGLTQREIFVILHGAFRYTTVIAGSPCSARLT
jgi:hypothetical protein